MMNKIFKISLLAFIFLVSINTLIFLKIELAKHYKNSGKVRQAICLYDRILRQQKAKRSLSDEKIARIYMELGILYAKQKLGNSALESFVNAYQLSSKIHAEDYYIKKNIENDKLLALGLLEAGKINKAKEEFERIKQIYSYWELPKLDKLIKTVEDLERKKGSPNKSDFLFTLGDTYIKNGLYGEARLFFTKRILDYGVDLIELVDYLDKKYGDNSDVTKSVWGRDIYVTLEDFESLKTKMVRNETTINSAVKAHYIDNDIFFKNSRSEWFDIAYDEDREPWDFDYLSKSVKIPINKNAPRLGLRVYIKPLISSDLFISINAKFIRSDITGVYSSKESRKVRDGWIEYRIDDLLKGAEHIAAPRNWSCDDVLIDKILINTRGVTNKFFIDEIELFLSKN